MDTKREEATSWLYNFYLYILASIYPFSRLNLQTRVSHVKPGQIFSTK